MLIDLHTHTSPSSYDALQTPQDLILEAKALGLDAVCLTEHDSFWDPTTLRTLSQDYNILVLPGCEINTDEGHFLAFGLTEYVFGMHKLSFLRRQIDKVGGALIAAHPYRNRKHSEISSPLSNPDNRKNSSDYLRYCEAIESSNGRGSQEENEFSRRIAANRLIPCTGGSDSHSPGDIGTALTKFSRRIASLDDLIKELRAGSFVPMSISKT